MRVLALNCGSSSLKWSVVDVDAGDDTPAATRTVAGETLDGVDDLREAARRVLARLGSDATVTASAHRIVHGGDRRDPVVVDDAVAAELEELVRLAPLHNRPGLDVLDVVRAALPVPAVAVFDTAFHAGMPPVAARYAIPPELAEAQRIRRYGFHGLAHRSMSERWAETTGRPRRPSRLVTCQLGGGASIAAVRDGRSVDTTMGFTPLEGLMMATRSGDVDPALPGHLVRTAGMTLDEVEDLLARRSGLLGVSGSSASAGELLEAEAAGDARASLALDMFCYRVRKQVGAHLAVLGGADAVVVGGGIGERFPEIRRRIFAGMAWCGIVLDESRNEACRSGDGTISDPTSSVEVRVLPPDEASVLARDATTALLDASTGGDNRRL